MKLTLEHIDKTINNLDRLMPAKLNKSSTREYSLKEGIFLMAPKLIEKKEMGCTANELVKSLADDGIVVKAATLNHYLCEYQKRHQGEAEAQPNQDESNSGDKKSSPLKSTANQDKPPVNQARQDTPEEEKPGTPSQSTERNRPESGQPFDNRKPETGLYAEKPKPEFGQSEKRGGNG